MPHLQNLGYTFHLILISVHSMRCWSGYRSWTFSISCAVMPGALEIRGPDLIKFFLTVFANLGSVEVWKAEFWANMMSTSVHDCNIYRSTVDPKLFQMVLFPQDNFIDYDISIYFHYIIPLHPISILIICTYIYIYILQSHYIPIISTMFNFHQFPSIVGTMIDIDQLLIVSTIINH